ncbi:SBBP repeat-containing protein [Leptospira interrogans]|uniref:SBBP repeat beta-propeller lipoprotein, LipL53 family n=1 Tax=Leptospira interrogans TaxID=173 RepID=UPI00202333EE|nr:SBBP repeat-containing protein [Leptospira interrogans]MCL8309072.1 SBBP repeat-containing protein [Leptospira interrogans]
MVRYLIFLFILFSNCLPTNVFGIAAPENIDYWIHFLLKIPDFLLQNNDPLHSDSQSDSELELDWTLLIGTEHAQTESKGIAVDQNGFIYVVGQTNGGVYIPRPIGTKDLILGKYDSHKNTIWTQQIGAPNVELNVSAMVVDRNGNVYVTGSTGNDGFFPNPLRSSEDMFLIKFNSDGTRGWITQAGPQEKESRTTPTSISIDTSGNIFIVGNSSGPFGGPELGANGFISKFDPQGNQTWVRQLFIARFIQISTQGVAFDRVRDIYVTGSGDANFETGIEINDNSENLFIFKYDNDNGNKQFFAQLLSSPLRLIQSNSITVDTLGNVFVGGNSNTDFGSGADRTSHLATLVKYNSLGHLQWIQQLGPAQSQDPQNNYHTTISSLDTDTEGNLYSIGSTNGNILKVHENSIGIRDLFFTKHNPSGELIWSRQIGAPNRLKIGNGIAHDLNGNLYYMGNTNEHLHGEAAVRDVYIFIVKYK